MNYETQQNFFESLRRHPEFLDDPDLRLDDFGYLIERYSYGAAHSFGWRVEKAQVIGEKDQVIGNIVGTRPLMG